ncbi:MAG: hypothetical protein Q7S00_00830, partial [bacterium]|nr:hypothetical protein [bacterium]
DIPRKQVFVEAVVMELVIDQHQSLGLAGSSGIPFTVKGNNLVGFGSLLGGSTAASTGLNGFTGGAVSTDTVNINITGADGTATTITVPKFFAALDAQQDNVDVNVLSTPNLLTLDNEKATIEIAQKEPFSQGQSLGSGGVTTQSFTREPVGLTLEITPQINEGNSVRLEIKQKKSDILNTAGPLTAVAGPSTKERSVETTVMANDGQTIVIGGLLEDTQRTTIRKVPLLGDIPVLGWLFKHRQKVKVKSNLLIFITPHVIRDVSDFDKILKRKIDERNTFIDRNYGKRQRKHVRDAIESHAKELLEYNGEEPASAEPVLPAPAPVPVVVPEVPAPVIPVPTTPAPVEPVPAPVVKPIPEISIPAPVQKAPVMPTPKKKIKKVKKPAPKIQPPPAPVPEPVSPEPVSPEPVLPEPELPQPVV